MATTKPPTELEKLRTALAEMTAKAARAEGKVEAYESALEQLGLQAKLTAANEKIDDLTARLAAKDGEIREALVRAQTAQPVQVVQGNHRG